MVSTFIQPKLNLIQPTASTPSPKFELRDYQKRVIAEIYGWYRSGKKSVMLVSATGSGKTLVVRQKTVG